MSDPEGLAVDSTGRLWVSDTVNSRVLRFDNAAMLANGASANGVLGQSDFSSSLFDHTQSHVAFPARPGGGQRGQRLGGRQQQQPGAAL